MGSCEVGKLSSSIFRQEGEFVRHDLATISTLVLEYLLRTVCLHSTQHRHLPETQQKTRQSPTERNRYVTPLRPIGTSRSRGEDVRHPVAYLGDAESLVPTLFTLNP